MAPFLDPGSKVFEYPERYGFTKLFHTIREHKQAMYQPSWKLYLSYYTNWMSRDQIAETTYEAMIQMNKLKMDIGVTSERHGETVEAGLKLARDIMRKIDLIQSSTKDESERLLRYNKLRDEIEEAKKSTVVSKKELRMPGLAGIRLKSAFKVLLKLFS